MWSARRLAAPRTTSSAFLPAGGRRPVRQRRGRRTRDRARRRRRGPRGRDKLSLLAPVAALTVGALAGRAPPGRGGSVVVPLVVAGGYWYPRNLLAVGNPLPWTSLAGCSRRRRRRCRQDTGFSVAHYATDTPGRTFGPGLPRASAAVVADPRGRDPRPLCSRSAGARRPCDARAGGARVAAGISGHAREAAGPAGHPLGFAFNIRYAAPALALSLTSCRSRRRSRRAPAPCPAGNRVRSDRDPGTCGPRATYPPCSVSRRSRSVVRRLPPSRLAAVRGGRAARRDRRLSVAAPLPPRPLRVQPGVSALSRAWALFRAVHDARVGVAGTFGGFFTYPLIGLDDSNGVQYIASRGPHGSFTPIGSCPAWRTSVNAGHYRYVVTTPARDPWHPKPLSPRRRGAGPRPIPPAHVVYRVGAPAQLIAVFELGGPLNPAACA